MAAGSDSGGRGFPGGKGVTASYQLRLVAGGHGPDSALLATYGQFAAADWRSITICTSARVKAEFRAGTGTKLSFSYTRMAGMTVSCFKDAFLGIVK